MIEKDKIAFYSELTKFCQWIEYFAIHRIGRIAETINLIAEIIRKAAEIRIEWIENKKDNFKSEQQ